MNFVERVLGLIAEHKISKNKLLTDLNLSKNSFVNWIDRGTTPSGDTIVQIAKYFNVSVDYLLGLSSSKNGTQTSEVTGYRVELLNISSDLTEEEQKMLVDYANLLKRGRG